MEQQIFTNDVILSWLQYYAKNTTLDLEHVKMIDITKKWTGKAWNWGQTLDQLCIYFEDRIQPEDFH